MGENEREGKPLVPASSLAADTGRGADNLANLGKRLDRYSVARRRAVEMSQYIAGLGLHPHAPDRKVLRELTSCGSYLVFRHYLESDRVRLHGMRSCRQHIICPLCAIRRGARMLARYVERVEQVIAENPRLSAHMVTLTVKNGADLGERFAHLQSSMHEFGKTRHRLRHDTEFVKALGAVWSYEFKRGEGSGLWHPHAHMVWLCEDAPDQDRLSRDWQLVTGDSFIVECHPLYGELVEAFCEVFKYAVKFADLPLDDNWFAFQTLRRRRLIGSCGNLRGVTVPPDLTDDLLDEARWVDLLFLYVHGRGYRDRGVINSSREACNDESEVAYA